ncbi:recombinase family protein [Bosea sp. NBC_00550]|uniref:recombinase family protein n=1 Tax=Bosea sp. NBC_00550 TaxID=2969621 RepID=UPI00222EE98B|nr:recombinase family protein [Bosea sp. NBC_00550]UZF95265.1 recombinase family protein [Bosea sp. NBC_00550]
MPPHHGKFVSYLRVSTQRQGRSGLGLEAQRKAVTDFLDGGRWQLKQELVEVESGKHADRPQLQAAFEACKLYGATLVIAKLDRLSRDAHFLLGLQKAGVRFLAVDMPEANELVVGIMAVVAQAERMMISTRTKAALAAAKARGTKLGNPNGIRAMLPHIEGGRQRSRQVIQAGADERAQRLASVFLELEAQGVTSANATAKALTERGISTARGGQWTARAIINMRNRLNRRASST